MTRKQEHDRIERLERELRELKASHEQRVADDCCCHRQHFMPWYPWYPMYPHFWWNGTMTTGHLSIGDSYVLDSSTPFTLTSGST